jgi:hypothetical protein
MLRGMRTTGIGGQVPSYADMHTWAAEQADANVAIPLPFDVIGIDVDDYDDKKRRCDHR